VDAGPPRFFWFEPSRAVSYVQFTVGSSQLTGDANGVLLREVAAIVMQNGLKISVEGDADPSEGPNADRLSRERAQHVRDALAKLGVDSSAITVVSHGAHQPYALGDEGRRVNPRVTFHVVQDAGM
jgi:outer membrane protein OmpA-like peptidoglycan-associated protein